MHASLVLSTPEQVPDGVASAQGMLPSAQGHTSAPAAGMLVLALQQGHIMQGLP